MPNWVEQTKSFWAGILFNNIPKFWMDERTFRRMDKQTDEWTAKRTDKQTEEWTDKQQTNKLTDEWTNRQIN